MSDEKEFKKVFDSAHEGWFVAGKSLEPEKNDKLRKIARERRAAKKRDILSVTIETQEKQMRKPMKKGMNYYTIQDYNKVPVDMEQMLISGNTEVLNELLDRQPELKAIGRVEVGDLVMMADPEHYLYNKKGELLEIREKPMTQPQYRVKFGTMEVFLRREDIVRVKKGSK